MAAPSDSPIKFPVKTPQVPTLALRRRLAVSRAPFEVSAASAAARESIKSFVSSTRTPWGEPKVLTGDRAGELERSLRQLETLLTERERAVNEAEARLAERERDLAEMEALVVAREKLMELARRQKPSEVNVSKEEQAVLEQLRTELEKQETALKEGKHALREREQFLEESETKLFEKVQAQQEKEVELDQREEELRAKALRLREREAAIDPAAAAVLSAEKAAAKKFDEFNE